MGVIHKLPTELSLKIAAGEVVERPASVVKELIDNALDARASSIRIDIERAGLTLIRVTDNGCGMAREDVLMAIERHATSKIHEAEDLASIITMGFRGEALAAIASVSEMEILTRRDSDNAGTRLLRSPDKEPVVADAGCPAGTAIMIRDLFVNLPARRKFLKSESTEFKHIHDAVIRAALAWETVHFALTHDGKPVFEAPRGRTKDERVRAILGRKVFEELHPVSHTSKEMLIEGFVSRPSFTRPTSGHVMTFVNDRYIQNRTILAAVSEAYKSAIEPRRYPTGVLYIELDPSEFDINVHPSKMEIKFADENAIFRGVLVAVKSAISGETMTRSGPPIPLRPQVIAPPRTDRVSDAPGPLSPPMPPPQATPSMLPPSDAPVKQSPPVERKPSGGARDYDFERSIRAVVDSQRRAPIETLPIPAHEATHAADDPPAADSETEIPASHVHTPEPSRHRGHHLGLLQEDEGNERIWGAFRSREYEIRPIGQAMNLYIIGEMGNNIVIIDQHAAHERILFEKFRAERNARAIARQSLLFPLTLELSAGDARLVAENLDTFQEMGFEIRPFGENSFIVETVPADLLPSAVEEFLRDLADDMRDGFKQWSPEDRREHMLATMACRAAIKAGDPLTPAEIEGLVRQINQLNQPETCPHGRPKVLVFSDDELRRQFKRK